MDQQQLSPDGKWRWDGEKWVAVEQAAPPPPKKRRPRGLWIALGAVLLLVGTCTAALVATPTPQGKPAGAKVAVATSTPTAQPTPTATATPARTPTPAPKATGTPTPDAAAKLAAAQKAQVQAALQGAIDHYMKAFSDGQAALGTTQYADAYAGLAAFNDPNSAASKFSAWRSSSRVEQDAQTYLDAFKQADAFYNADNEPTDAIEQWETDTGDLQAAISQWVEVAVSWQIRTKSDADLRAAATAVTAKANAARADVGAVIAAS